MRPSFYAVTSILLASLSVGQVPPAPEVAGPGTRIAWDHDGLAEDGTTPEQLASFEVAAFDQDGVALVASRTIPACEASGPMTCEEALAPLGLSSGTYTLRIRAVDTVGLQSAWGDPLLVRLDTIPPSRPTGCRLLR